MREIIVENSILGQKWLWRAHGADARDPDFTPDDLVTQLLLGRGVARDVVGELPGHGTSLPVRPPGRS
jgi:hypothetical protein